MIGVVVPVYNVGNYLQRCLDSLINQTLKNKLIIAVDDGSFDDSSVICDSFALNNDAAIVIHQNNGGLSCARNHGIDLCMINNAVEWLTFVDSDDWVRKNYLQQLMNLVLSNKTDISMCGFSSDSTSIFESQAKVKVFSITELFLAEYPNNTLPVTSACGKLYSKELFSDIRFPNGKINEDRFTTYKVIFKVDSVACNLVPLYYYTQRTDSITHKKWTPANINDIEAYEQQLSFFKSVGEDKIFNRYFYNYLYEIATQIELSKKNNAYRRQHLLLRKKLKAVLKKGVTMGIVNYGDIYLFSMAYPIKSIPLRIENKLKRKK